MRRPEPNESAQYYHGYINLVPDENIVEALQEQLKRTETFLGSISEEKSLSRYAPEKWTIRQVLNHVNDGERIFSSRLLWFARGFQDPLPSFDQDVCTETSGANDVAWKDQVEEFRNIRLGTISLLQNLPNDAWDRSGVASDNPFTVRALAYIIAGHVTHHVNVLKERYL
jgi:uncharacterized damage-inducible protein DinB